MVRVPTHRLAGANPLGSKEVLRVRPAEGRWQLGPVASSMLKEGGKEEGQSPFHRMGPREQHEAARVLEGL